MHFAASINNKTATTTTTAKRMLAIEKQQCNTDRFSISQKYFIIHKRIPSLVVLRSVVSCSVFYPLAGIFECSKFTFRSFFLPPSPSPSPYGDVLAYLTNLNLPFANVNIFLRRRAVNERCEKEAEVEEKHFELCQR